MIRFFLLTFRHALRFRTYTIINIGGLALGFASAIAILHFVADETSYDKFHREAYNVYRLNTVTQRENGLQRHAAGTPILAPTLMTDLPEVEAAVRLRHADDVLIRVDESQFYEDRVFYADSNFFKVLSFELEKGNPSTALTDLNCAVITAEFAEKYFGKDDPLNKLINVNDLTLKVTGVTAPPRGRSHFKFDILISFETFTVPKGYPISLTGWGWTSFPTYVRLREGYTAADAASKFPAFISKYFAPESAKNISYELQPITEVYLHSRDILERDGISTKGDYAYTVGMGAIAILILAIACFNFINLSTALSTYRVKETGVKRTFGSGKWAIFFQALAASIFMAGISLAIAILLLSVGRGSLEELLGTTLSLSFMDHMRWLSNYIILVILVGCCGGLYPAFFLSRLQPQLALKGKNVLTVGNSRFHIRKAIIVFQFFITAALIATSLTIKRQMDFLFSKDLGFEKESVIALRVPDLELMKMYSPMKNKLLANPMVRKVSAGRYLFVGEQGVVGVNEIGNSEDSYGLNFFPVFPDFVETLGLEMKEGRSFSEAFNDSSSFILNESAVKMFGWDHDVIGRRIQVMQLQGKVIGVVKDFHFSSLHAVIGPMVMQLPRSKIELIFVKVGPGAVQKTLNALESDWRTIAPQLPFDYVLLDEHIGEIYKQDKRFSQLAYFFCGLSIALACLGLYGVISFMTESRTKEIGIRKVLGASVFRITTLLSGQFMVWVIVGAMIALPVSHYLLNRWLSAFAYKIDISQWILIISVLLSSMLAALTVGFRSFVSANANPVDSLRSE